MHHKEVVADAAKKAKALGKSGGAAVIPAFRVPWVVRPLVDTNGHFVDISDSRHPLHLGPGRLNYGWSADDYA